MNVLKMKPPVFLGMFTYRSHNFSAWITVKGENMDGNSTHHSVHRPNLLGFPENPSCQSWCQEGSLPTSMGDYGLKNEDLGPPKATIASRNTLQNRLPPDPCNVVELYRT